MQTYSDPKRASDPYALPDVEVFHLTAYEAVQQDEDLMWEAGKRFPLMNMNSRDRDKAIAWAVESSGTTGGWFWWTCFPGCMPDSSAFGTFATREEALADAQQNADIDDE